MTHRTHLLYTLVSLLLLFFAPGAAWTQSRTIKIATQSQLSGEQAGIGEPIKLGSQLAVEEAVKKFKSLGYDLALAPYDDEARPETGVANAHKMAADPDVLLVVGHYNSGVALPASEIYRQHGLAMISPGATHPSITDRGYANVNRVCGRDDVQGPAGARLAAQDLNVGSVYVVHDKTLYGQGVADAFRQEAGALGLKIVGDEGTEEKATFAPLIASLKARKPDLLYFGGIYHQGAILLKQMRESGLKTIVMGPDGFDSSEMVKIAGAHVIGTYYTTVAGPVRAYPAAGRFAKAFKARFGKEAEAFAMYGYDAAAVGLAAIELALRQANGAKPARAQVAAAIRSVKNFKGVTGSISFDAKGDPLKAKYFVLRFDRQQYPGRVVRVIEQAPPAAKTF